MAFSTVGALPEPPQIFPTELTWTETSHKFPFLEFSSYVERGYVVRRICYDDRQIKIRQLIGRSIGAGLRSDNNGGPYVSPIRGPSREPFNEILHGTGRNRSNRL